MKMTLIDNPTERRTAGTEVALSALALACAGRLTRMTDRHPWKVRLWTFAFITLALASLLGALFHGIKTSQERKRLLLNWFNFVASLTVAAFGTGTIIDYRGEQAAKKAFMPLLGISVACSLAMKRIPKSFYIFLAYETVVMLATLAVYGQLALKGRLAGAHLVAASTLMTISAAAVQSSRLSLYSFDHNGLFTLIQMASLPVLTTGILEALEQPSTPS